ncbi:SAV_915 family protein [Streptomyces daliensis]
MAEFSSDDDPGEPSPRRPAEVPVPALYVPVTPGPAGCVPRLFRTPPGDRTAVGFTARERLADVLGAAQGWVRLSEPALRALAEPLGVELLTVDPQFAAPAVTPGRVTALAALDDPRTGRAALSPAAGLRGPR